MSACRTMVAVGLACACAAALSAQQATFRGGRDLVRVEVTVLEKNRQPVRGLTAADFTVTIDGKPRPIAAFAPVDVPSAEVAPGPEAWTRQVVDVATNTAPAEGRLLVILMDRSIPPGEPTLTARRIAAAAVQQLAPADLAAVIYMGPGTPQNFTADKALLLRAITGANPSGEPSADAQEAEDATFGDAPDQMALLREHAGDCYCGLCYPETIERIATVLRDVPRRKVLLFIGTSLTIDSADIDCGSRLREAREKMFKALDVSNLTIDSASPTGLETISAAARSSSPVNNVTGRGISTPIQTTVVNAFADNLRNESSLHILPDYTGGRVISNTNDPMQLVPRIFAESGSYYVLGVEPVDPGRPDRPHKIEVHVARKDVNVRARRAYTDDPPLAVNGSGASALSALVTGIMPGTALPLGVAVVPFAAPGKPDAVALLVVGVRQPVDVSGGAPGAGAPFAPAGPGSQRNEHLAVLASAFDQYARPKAVDQRAFEVTFSSGGVGELRYEVFSQLSLKPGHYEVRVGAADAEAARSGSVYTYVDVPDFAREPLSASGVLLEARPSPVSPTQTVVTNLVPITPTARRTFQPSDLVRAFMRVYQGGSSALVPVTVTTGVFDAHDRLVQEGKQALPAARFGAGRSSDYRVQIPTAALSPGAYLLVIQAATDTRSVVRRLVFSIQ